jgi:MFS family permease
MPNPYAAVLRTPGARAFVAAGFVGRLPLSMLALGTALLLTGSGRSYAFAGAASATLSLSLALVGPQLGRLTDRFGQRRVLLPALAVHALALVALVLCGRLGASPVAIFAAAAVTGAAFPMLGAFVRARWTALIGGTPALPTAFALESVLDEIVFVLGPVVVTVLATAVTPSAGLLLALGCSLGGGLALAAQRATEPSVLDGTRGAALRVPGMRLLVLVFAGVGAIFGTVDVAMVAFAQQHGAKGAAGPLLGIYGATSALAGALYGARHWRAPLARRLRVSLLLLALSALPMALVDGLWPMAAVTALAGLAVAPTLIAGFALVETLVPRAALTEGLTWLETTIAGGVAVGYAVSGHVIDATSGRTAFLVAVVAGCLASGALALGHRRLAAPHGGAPPRMRT